MTATKPIRTYKLSLHDSAFRGNHRDFRHYRIRKGDEVSEVSLWGRDTAGHWANRHESTHSIAKLIEDLSYDGEVLRGIADAFREIVDHFDI